MIVGVCGFRFAVLSPLRRAGGGTWIPPRERHLARLGAAAGAVLVLVSLWRLYAQTYSIFGVDEGISWESFRIVVADTPWGAGWIVQLAAAAFAATTYWYASIRPREGWWLAGGAALAVGGSLAFTGHALSEADPVALSVALQIAHVIGAGLWIGTLALLVFFGLIMKDVPAPERVAHLMVNAFSPLAIAGVGVLAVTGVVTAVLYLESVSQLWTSWYGRVLVVKVLLFASVGAFGAYNWRRLRPQLGTPSATTALTKSAAIELSLAALVLGITSVLVALPLDPLEPRHMKVSAVVRHGSCTSFVMPEPASLRGIFAAGDSASRPTLGAMRS